MTEESNNFFKKIDEKNVNQEVKLMLWNPKMDLIAIAFQNGDVHLYRMSWQKVWSVNNTQQNVSITSMAWRPDGKSIIVSLIPLIINYYSTINSTRCFLHEWSFKTTRC
jgi:WD40 repeat protein